MSREEALRELVEKWRKQAENIKKQSLDREPGYFQWLECNREHAGELEAILAQPAPAQQETLAAESSAAPPEPLHKVNAKILLRHLLHEDGYVRGDAEATLKESLDAVVRQVKEKLAAPQPAPAEVTAEQWMADSSGHSDDIHVDGFAVAMKNKLAKKRAEGYGGWDNPQECDVKYLAKLLLEHLKKPDMVDIANFAMMLHYRIGGGEALALLAAAKGGK